MERMIPVFGARPLWRLESGCLAAKFLLGAEPVLCVVSMLVAALDPELVGELRYLVVADAGHLGHVRRSAIGIFGRGLAGLGGSLGLGGFLDGLSHIGILLKIFWGGPANGPSSIRIT